MLECWLLRPADRQTEFEAASEEAAQYLRNELDRYEVALTATAGLFRSSQEVMLGFCAPAHVRTLIGSPHPPLSEKIHPPTWSG